MAPPVSVSSVPRWFWGFTLDESGVSICLHLFGKYAPATLRSFYEQFLRYDHGRHSWHTNVVEHFCEHRLSNRQRRESLRPYTTVRRVAYFATNLCGQGL